jgi:hypothetical protein
MEFYVYVYTDPTNGLPFYVGKGQAGRYKDHLSWTHNRFLRNKLAKMKSQNIVPRIDIVFKSKDEDLVYEVEEHLIKSYGIRNSGGLLCNFSIGGRGNRAYDFTEEHISLMGTITDEELAKVVGCTRSNVSHVRRGLGIPACEDRPNYSPPPPMGGWNKKVLPQECIDRLGTTSDSKLAAEFGTTRYVIAQRRKELGIPSHAEVNNHPYRAKKGNQLHLDKTIRKFRNIETGEVWEGIRFDFAEYIGVKSSLLGGLISGRNKTSYGWEMLDNE